MEIKKASGLYSLFLRYLCGFCGAVIFFAALMAGIFYWGLTAGIILPANHAEQALRQAEATLQNSVPFDASAVPYPCTYSLFSNGGELTGSSMSPQAQQQALLYLTEGSNESSAAYRVIVRADGYCVIQYDMLAHFSSPAMHRLFPKPELLAFPLFLGFFLLSAAMTAARFRKKLNTQLSPLIAASDAIKRQDLSFQADPTQVREFNAVLDSIQEIGGALQASLSQQWQAEHTKQTQMAALAHDMKTPLTILSGNTELLLEANPNEEQKELLTLVHSNARQMRQYLSILMDTATAENPDALAKADFSTAAFLEELLRQARTVSAARQISLSADIQPCPETLHADRTLLFRGLMNLFENAMEHSPAHTEVTFRVEQKAKFLTFIISDCGKGFTASGLTHAAEPFYTEHEARSSMHYGMGLFLAHTAAQKHGGQLRLANRSHGSGAVVTLMIPCARS